MKKLTCKIGRFRLLMLLLALALILAACNKSANAQTRGENKPRKNLPEHFVDNLIGFEIYSPKGWHFNYNYLYMVVFGSINDKTNIDIKSFELDFSGDINDFISGLAKNEDGTPNYDILKQEKFITESGIEGVKCILERNNREQVYYFRKDSETVIGLSAYIGSTGGNDGNEKIIDEIIKTFNFISVSTNASDYITNGKKAFEVGGEYRAMVEFSKAIELDPNNIETYGLRGLALYTRLDYESAIADYTKAIELSPPNYTIFYNRGRAYEDNGKLGKAVEDYRKALEINPNLSDARQKLDSLSSYLAQQELESKYARYQIPEDNFDVAQLQDGTLAITGYESTSNVMVFPAKLFGVNVSTIGGGAPQTPEDRAVATLSRMFGVSKANTTVRGVTPIKTVIIQNGIKIIADEAFMEVGDLSPLFIEYVLIPSSVVQIGNKAFFGGLAFRANTIRNVVFPSSGLKRIGDEAFAIGSGAWGTQHIIAVIIPSSVEYIGAHAFAHSSIDYLEINNGFSVPKNTETNGVPSPIFVGSDFRSIKICAGLTDEWLKYVFPANFSNYYVSQGRRAGIYVFNGKVWLPGSEQDVINILKEYE